MVFCTYCGQSFTRDEHLERHILTHTNVKPFKCFNCHMSFARRDLLQRHYQVHGKDQNNQELDPAANGMIPKSAGRTPIACTNCAKTKTKCDKKFPCSRCEARNLHCTARPARRAPKNGSRNGISLDSSGTVVAGALEPGKETEQTAGPPHRPPLRPLGPAPPVTRAPVPADEKSVVPTVDGPPSQHFEALTGGPQTAAIMRTPTTAPAPFINHTPFSNYEEFQQMPGDSSESDSSPRFMIDWNHPMQMALGFDGSVQPQMLLTPDVSYDPAAMHSVPSGDNMLGITGPQFGHGMVAPLITPPMEMPKLERGFSHAGIHDHSPVQARSRHLSYSNVGFGHLDDDDDDVQGEMQAIVAARDGWTCFRCTPTIASASCPKTARLNLERLEKTLKNHDGWSTWTPQWDEAEPTRNDNLTLMQLHESTRDKLLAITQTFLHKALEIHRGSAMPGYLRDSSIRRGSNFVLLPPAHVLAYFLRSYSNCFEHYYPLTSRGTLDANELMHCYNDRAASLLVLMMIAQGAMNIPCVEARMLTGGLTEACRISLFDLIEKDISMAGDPIVLHSALIFTVQAAWSGDKWQMDIAMGQRGMYLAMLRHSGVLDPSPQSVVMPSPHNSQVNHDQLWNEWIQLESRSRLVYSWVMVDQELALFHDTAPLFSVAEFNAPMPDADRLWRAQSAMAWSTEFEQVHEFSSGYSSVGSGVRPLSLRALFRYFLDDEIDSRKIQMTPLQLRLLLHPLQTMVCQCVQFLSCVSDASVTPAGQGPSTASTRNRLFEIQELLRRWFKLSELHSSPEPSAIMQTNLVIFHLISLNVVTDFPAIEQLARHHISLISNPFENCANASSSTTAPGSSYGQNTFHQLRSRCIADLEEVVYHCGQILRLVREMPRGVRPPWWAGAIYRVALTLWTDAIAPSAPHLSQQTDQLAVATGVFQDLGFAIDNVAADDALLVQYLTKRQGVPRVTSRDGSIRGINDPTQIVLHCCELIEDGAATRFSDGIKAKLAKLAGV